MQRDVRKIESIKIQNSEGVTNVFIDRDGMHFLSEVVNTTQNSTDDLKKMKQEVEMYKKAIESLSKKIKEEENRRKKEEYHLIELKKRKMQVEDEILMGTCKTEYQTTAKKFKDNDLIKYIREGNKVICTITNDSGQFKGIAKQHPEDEFNYEKGMQLAKVRAMREMYSSIVYDLEHSF